MCYIVKILFWLLIFLRQEAGTKIEVTKFTYPQDLSEHCRRHVIPSVFLGRHVVDAYSKVLHFEKIDLPYSCYITVRAETGSNIILVLQLVTDTSHQQPCEESSNQMLVYEMGETFGGYWGALPDNYMMSRPSTNRMYTLKTSKRFKLGAPPIETTPVTVTEETTTPQPSESGDITEQQGLIELEIPLANVSAIVEPGAYRPDKLFNIDENFDLLYDVIPGEKVSYQTSILPLAQITFNNLKNERQGGTRNKAAQYQFDYNLVITPDIRLTYPRVRGVTQRRILFPNYTYANRLRKPYRGKHPLMAIQDKKSNIKRLKTSLRRHSTTDPNKYEFIISKTTSGGHTAAEVKSIDVLMKQFNDSNNNSKASDNKENNKINNQINIAALLAELSNIGYNASAYLYPEFKNNNLSRNDKNTFESTRSENNHSLIESSLPFTPQSKPSLTTIFETPNTGQFTLTSKPREATLNNINSSVSQVFDIQKNINKSDTATEDIDFRTANANKGNYIMKLATSSTISWTHQNGSLVDHESWENVVQVAPVIAHLLNQTAQDANAMFSERNILNSTEIARKKRHLHAIPIDNAKPRTITTKETVPTTVPTAFYAEDVQDFFGLVELSDDEMHERVALKYLRQYLGPTVFNICEFKEPKERYVALFNSSRIVIALTNFTIEKLTVVMTPGRTMLENEYRCPPTNIECQVAGTRVCINSMSACDGVPNCGAYDIFDEDRLMCGAAVGLQHNVWLAALTFLALMLTVLYTVHYWLTRCVPKVSEAFFIFTDGDEKTLYLDPIMRSPNDISGPMYGNLIGDEILCSDERNIRTKALSSCSWVAKLFNKFKKNKSVEDDNSAHQIQPVKRMYSFTQTEIRKIANNDFTDVCVQTGESLEMSDLGVKNVEKAILKTKNVTDSRQSGMFDRPVGKWDIRSIESKDKSYELSLIKLLKDSKGLDSSESKEAVLSLTLDSISDHRLRGSTERVLESHLYEHTRRQSAFPTTSSIRSVTTVTENQSDVTSQTQPKRLRFIEEPVAIHTTINEEFIEKGQRIVEIDVGQRTKESRYNREDSGQAQSTSRDFKRFFSSGKGKKAKNKKSQMTLR